MPLAILIGVIGESGAAVLVGMVGDKPHVPASCLDLLYSICDFERLWLRISVPRPNLYPAPHQPPKARRA